MRYLYLLLFFLFFFNLSAQLKIDSLRYKRALKAPQTTDVKFLARFLKVGAKTDNKIVETFYYWIAHNITYDAKLYKDNNATDEDVSVKSILVKRKTICDGYSNLILELCQAVKIECIKIIGYGKNYDSETEGHAWNAVKINGKWQLIDVTWGTGSFLDRELQNYSKEIDLKYLFGDPDYFIIDHFPEEESWQLLDFPINKEKFLGSEWDEKRLKKYKDGVKIIEIELN